MQEKSTRTPNSERRAQMRARLITAARAVFVEKGYAEASTPEIVRAAGATRGALYHHFEDKQALFRAVVEAEAQAVTQAIETAGTTVDTRDALAEGSRAFFDAMSDAARAQLLLVDGPAVLGAAEMDRIDAGGGRQSLLAGLKAVRPDHDEGTLTAMAVVLSASFDRAALEVAQSGADPTVFEGVLNRLVEAALAPK
ncbi:MAG: TetR/AcrR family transcriptional regulator [Shimia sp.]|nr:TetR/AcrR family transcriptional regulator [Shimia sp.]MCP4822774.1 TetR/AcrR family transcriptional regulator [Shimia sp.]